MSMLPNYLTTGSINAYRALFIIYQSILTNYAKNLSQCILQDHLFWDLIFRAFFCSLKS